MRQRGSCEVGGGRKRGVFFYFLSLGLRVYVGLRDKNEGLFGESVFA